MENIITLAKPYTGTIIVALILLFFIGRKLLKLYRKKHIKVKEKRLELANKEKSKQLDEYVRKQKEDQKNGIFTIRNKNKLMFTSDDAIMNFHRSVFICGGAGSGKTFTFIVPLIKHLVVRFPCIIYDYKNPELIKEFLEAKKNLYLPPPRRTDKEEMARLKLKHYIIDFKRPHESSKINPIAPKYIPTESHAREYAYILFTNLKGKSNASADPFWDDSAIALLTGCLWYLKENDWNNCNIPNLLKLVLRPVPEIIERLKENDSSRMICAYLISAYDTGELKLITNVAATLQMQMSILVNETVNTIFSADETPLDINCYDNPTQLLIGNNEELSSTYAPLISLIMAVAIKQMNRAELMESYILIDEAPTLYIPKLEELPAVARSRRISLIYACQDISQIDVAYGKEKREVLLSNLGNQFFGRTTNQTTIKYIIDFAGQKEQIIFSESHGESYGSSKSYQSLTSSDNQNHSSSSSSQMRNIYNSSDITELSQGQFIFSLCESKKSLYKGYKRPLSGKAHVSIGYYIDPDLVEQRID